METFFRAEIHHRRSRAVVLSRQIMLALSTDVCLPAMEYSSVTAAGVFAICRRIGRRGGALAEAQNLAMGASNTGRRPGLCRDAVSRAWVHQYFPVPLFFCCGPFSIFGFDWPVGVGGGGNHGSAGACF